MKKKIGNPLIISLLLIISGKKLKPLWFYLYNSNVPTTPKPVPPASKISNYPHHYSHSTLSIKYLFHLNNTASYDFLDSSLYSNI